MKNMEKPLLKCHCMIYLENIYTFIIYRLKYQQYSFISICKICTYTYIVNDSVDVSSRTFHNFKGNSSPIVLIEIPTIVLKEGRSERGYNPETPSNFWNNLKVTPLHDTPTEAGISGVCQLVKLLWLHPHDRHQEAVVLIGLVLR